ncbi:hypothetical protein ACTFIR_009898 [Dictyostelium discoideum]
MQIYLFIFLFISLFLNINGSMCNFKNPNKNSFIDLEPIFNLTDKPYFHVFMGYSGQNNQNTSDIYFDLCKNNTLAVCNGNGTNACQIFSNKTYSLGSFYSIAFDNDNIQIRYKGYADSKLCNYSTSYENSTRVTDFHFRYFCDCDNCAQNHSSCYNGKCQCDQYTTGETCNQLKINITQVISKPINGSICYLFGNFVSIVPNFEVFIGDLKCEYTKLIDPTKIEMSAPPGSGNQSITITDGISSYYSPILFEYINVQCLGNCSQIHGECNLYLGVCICDSQTNGTSCENSRMYIDSIDPTDENGGTTYLYGYFGNTSNLNIQIGDTHCNNTQQINETLIKCDVGIGSGFKDVLLQDRDLQVKVENLFQYFQYIL